MKKFEKAIWVVLVIQLLLIVVIVRAFSVDDVTLSSGEVYSFDEGWNIERAGREEKIHLPYAAECKAGEKVIIRNVIPREYHGMSLFFLSADKSFSVRIDGKEVYQFGMNDRKQCDDYWDWCDTDTVVSSAVPCKAEQAGDELSGSIFPDSWLLSYD